VRVPLRWVALLVFVLSSVLNYLDRQILATMVDIWRSRPEFPFSYSDYGLLLSVFSIAYAVSAPFMGWFLDRAGLNRGISVSVATWAVASAGTGLSHGTTELLFWRAILGVAEAAGISAVGKVIGMYLLPEERALGNATSQLGISVGLAIAPRFTVLFAYEYSWRWTFFAAAILSLLWIPLWLATSRLIPPSADYRGPSPGVHSESLLRDPQLWALVIANGLSMTIYSLWTNWSPTYLVQLGLKPQQAANYSWIIPLCGYAGGFIGGSLSWRFIRQGQDPVQARKRVCYWAAIACLATAVIPFFHSPAMATAGMSFSFFSVAAWSTNLYTLPVDIYGAARAGFAVSGLVCAFGVMQATVSKPLGFMIEHYGFMPVCLLFAGLPLIAYAIIRNVRAAGAVSYASAKPSTNND
jgi:ACS family hexuronate transporter-like MFS transporter